MQGISLKKGKNRNFLIYSDNCLQGRTLKMLAFSFEGSNTDLQIWNMGVNDGLTSC